MTVEQEPAAALCAKCGGPVEMEGFEGRATCKPCGMPTDLCTCESQQAEE